jgi:4-amino-4-deoxy-L-arabinose transferase-like glycosyltransferase
MSSQHRPLLVLLLVSAVLLVAWAFAIPIYEAPDETWHWNYARYVHENLSIPPYTPTQPEANSPPLYYFLIAPVAYDTAVPTPILESLDRPSSSPRIFINELSDIGRYWPIRLARLVSVLLSVVGVMFAYLAAAEATGRTSTGILAGGVMALWPQFTFRGMNVSNDALVTVACAAVTYFLVRLLRRGFTWHGAVIAAVLSAVAFLSKATALFLLIPLATAILWSSVSWRERIPRLLVLLVPLAIASPWLLRNQILYGDPLASRAMLTVVGNLVDVKPITSPYFWTTFPTSMFISSVGVFGMMNLLLPAALYSLYGIVVAAAILACSRLALQPQADRRLLVLLAAFPLLSLAVAIRINLTFTQPQGRYLFPALAAMAVLGACGFEALPRWNTKLAYTLLATLALLNVIILTCIVIPSYWPHLIDRLARVLL